MAVTLWQRFEYYYYYYSNKKTYSTYSGLDHHTDTVYDNVYNNKNNDNFQTLITVISNVNMSLAELVYRLQHGNLYHLRRMMMLQQM